MTKWVVIGAGAWGTALAQVLASKDNQVTLIGRDAQVIETINAEHENPKYLPGVGLSKSIFATDKYDVLKDAAHVVLATPSQTLPEVMQAIKPYLNAAATVILTAKGFQIETGKLLSDLVDVPTDRLAILSGPTFAIEVAAGKPAALVIAGKHAKALTEAFATPTFRPYPSEDIIGVQVAGAVKNVLAIASGIVTGQGLGDNACAALITRGLAEIMRLGIRLGAKPETFFGLAGLGDISLTCHSEKSRNYALGLALGKGQSIESYQAIVPKLVEGVATTKAVHDLAKNLDCDLPICRAVYSILYENKDVEAAIYELMSRPLTDKEL